MNRRPALSSSRRFRAEFKPRLGTARAHTRIGGELFLGGDLGWPQADAILRQPFTIGLG